jgi:hypothetical protein
MTGLPVFPEVSGFFTVNPAERKTYRLSVEKIDLLRGIDIHKTALPFSCDIEGLE